MEMYQESAYLGAVVACPEASVDAGHYKVCSPATTRAMVHYGGHFRGAAATLCIASENAPNRVTPKPRHPNASVQPVLSPRPLNQKWDSSILSPVVNSDQLYLHVVFLSPSDVLAVFNATR